MSSFHHLARPALTAAGLAFLLALPFELRSTVLSDQPFVDVAQTLAHVAAAALAMVGFVMLGLGIPGLAARGGTRGRLGSTTAVLAMLGAFAGATLRSLLNHRGTTRALPHHRRWLRR